MGIRPRSLSLSLSFYSPPFTTSSSSSSTSLSTELVGLPRKINLSVFFRLPGRFVDTPPSIPQSAVKAKIYAVDSFVRRIVALAFTKYFIRSMWILEEYFRTNDIALLKNIVFQIFNINVFDAKLNIFLNFFLLRYGKRKLKKENSRKITFFVSETCYIDSKIPSFKSKLFLVTVKRISYQNACRTQIICWNKVDTDTRSNNLPLRVDAKKHMNPCNKGRISFSLKKIHP